MGQRIQILFEVPEIYWNPDNPNNRAERILVYHNQWLYGMNFLKYADRLIKAILYLINAEMVRGPFVGDEKGYPIVWDDIVQNSVDHANHVDLDYLTNTNLYFNDGTGDKEVDEAIMKAEDALDFLKEWDNNNGYLFIKIKKDGTICYDILNGTENADEIKSRTPMEFLRLFYTAKEIKGDEFDDTKKAIESLKSFERTNCFREINSFIQRKKGIVPSTSFNTRIEFLANGVNENG